MIDNEGYVQSLGVLVVCYESSCFILCTPLSNVWIKFSNFINMSACCQRLDVRPFYNNIYYLVRNSLSNIWIIPYWSVHSKAKACWAQTEWCLNTRIQQESTCQTNKFKNRKWLKKSKIWAWNQQEIISIVVSLCW